jgi:hypothetical protein
MIHSHLLARIALPVLLGVMTALAPVTAVEAKQARSRAAVAQFKRAHPCPVTHAPKGKCSGWEVDHVTPLCAGGPDTPANMQWLTISEHRQKTKQDVMHCRRLKAGRWAARQDQ